MLFGQVGGSSRQLEWNYALCLEFAELDRYLHIIFSQEKFCWFITNFVSVVCWSAKLLYKNNNFENIGKVMSPNI